MIANFVSIPTGSIVGKKIVTLAMKSDQHLPLTMDNAKAPKKIPMLMARELSFCNYSNNWCIIVNEHGPSTKYSFKKSIKKENH